MITALSPFLAFQGNAKEAVAFYLRALPGAEAGAMLIYGPQEEGAEGTVKYSSVKIGESTLRIIDVPKMDGFDMTGGLSMFVSCSDPADVDAIASSLGEGREALMTPGEYPFADRFAWIVDPFGVHWQMICGHRLEGAG